MSEITRRLPGGFENQVGEGGRALSVGERQRVSVARALLKKAPIVLFDEATSALDAENEANVVAAMQQLRADATVVVIAHKLETIMTADQLIVLDGDGRIAQLGTHAELVDEPLIVVLRVHHVRQADLLEVAQTAGLARLLACAGEYREEDGCQNRDDRDYNEELNERETTVAYRHELVLSVLVSPEGRH